MLSPKIHANCIHKPSGLFIVIRDTIWKEYEIIMLIYNNKNMQVRFIMILHSWGCKYTTLHDEVWTTNMSKYKPI